MINLVKKIWNYSSVTGKAWCYFCIAHNIITLCFCFRENETILKKIINESLFTRVAGTSVFMLFIFQFRIGGSLLDEKQEGIVRSYFAHPYLLTISSLEIGIANIISIIQLIVMLLRLVGFWLRHYASSPISDTYWFYNSLCLSGSV